MPKTKFQDLIFTIIMVIAMVYCMTLYNAALEHGFDYSTFTYALKNMWFEVIAAFIAQKLIAGPTAKKLVSKILNPATDKPIFITIAMAGFTASLMAPMMTLFVTIFHNGFVKTFPLLWITKLVINFPFALCLQIFYIGPLVRFIFRTIFKKQLLEVPSKITA